MEDFSIRDLTFFYPEKMKPALCQVNLEVKNQEFITLCGSSGCGKSTLLRHLKTVLTPHGIREGSVSFRGQPLEEVDLRTQAGEIGFVQQSPDNQIVTDKVWHELAFGLESLGTSTPEIRRRVAEMASFFGIQTWFHKSVAELSGGQKQLLNLASVMVMQPSVLILDEPTSQLDPIAATDFLEAVQKINRELGVTVILSEHRLEDALPMSDRAVVIEKGQVIAMGAPRQVGQQLEESQSGMFLAMPAAMRIFAATPHSAAESHSAAAPCSVAESCSAAALRSAAESCFTAAPRSADDTYPLTVREGREWLTDHCQAQSCEKEWEEASQDSSEFSETSSTASRKSLESGERPEKASKKNSESASNLDSDAGRPDAVELTELWFRYDSASPDVVKGLSLNVKEGEFFAIVGGNGTGKSTALSLISGARKPSSGTVKIGGRNLDQIPDRQLFGGLLGVMPQNPQALFVKKKVEEDLYEMLSGRHMSRKEKKKQVERVTEVCKLEALLAMHPYDLSGGEQQRAALAKVLLLSPKILLLDEPTKGLDRSFQRELAGILKELQAEGTTIIMVSHDVEFCAEYADRCALFFDGRIAAQKETREFFAGNSFYTTAASRIARGVLPKAATVEDVITSLKSTTSAIFSSGKLGRLRRTSKTPVVSQSHESRKLRKVSKTLAASQSRPEQPPFSLEEFWENHRPEMRSYGEKRRLPKRTVAALIMILTAIPLTIFIGVFYMADRKYYFISLLIILETLLPFLMVFEGRKPKARETLILAVLSGIAVAGRAAFFMIPQFKPVMAVVIIAGVAFGGEAGFLVGAVTGFVSNFYFGQGPWTPWQMFSFGIVGFLAGILFRKGLLSRGKIALCIFGGLATFFIYGGLMNPASVLMFYTKPTWPMFALAYLRGVPFDLIHAGATVIFLFFLSQPMLEKLDRIKVKYGLIEPGEE